MASLLRERLTLGNSKMDSPGKSSSFSSSLMAMSSSESLPLPFGEVGCNLSDHELRETAYEIFVAACRNTAGKPLTYISSSERAAAATPSSAERSLSSVSSLSPSSSLQRSLTSTAASKMKKALGMKSSKKSPGKERSLVRTVKKPATIGDLMRVQMGVSDQTDSRIRRGLLRISASQIGRRVESIVLPLEFLQQFKASDFQDQQEFEAWRCRNLKVIEAGLLLHPMLALDKSNVPSQRLRQILRGALERPIETGKNSESMQALRSVVMSLASRSTDQFSSDTCHWADGNPLNLHLYHMLLEACFDSEEGSIIDEIDDVMELVKKTWVVLGITHMIHNLCFLWILFCRFAKNGQTDFDLLVAVDNQLTEVSKDSKSSTDVIYSKILSSTLSSIMGWTEKRLLTYHDTFNDTNIEFMEYILSIGVSSARILVEDISHEYRRKRKEVDVARSRIDTYIRSSLRTSFAQMMERADSNRRSAKNQNNSLPGLAILAKDIGDLANREKDVFSPILKKWHPLATGVAVATLHSCFGNELKQFISSVTDLTVDSVQVLKAADTLEKDLVQIAVEESVDSEDGGKGLIREMPPFEAESAIANLTKAWIKSRVDKLREWVDRNLQQEAWNPISTKEQFASSAVELLRLAGETLDAFFQVPIPMHPALLPDLMVGLDRSLQHYATKARAGCGTRNSFIPPLPSLTRVEVGSSLWKKKDKSQNLQRRRSQVGSTMGDASLGLLSLCVRMNTLHHLRTEVENLEKKVKTCLRNVESAQADITNGFDNKFELTLAACQDGIQQLCESTAYKLIFSDLSHALWDSLYDKDTAASRIDSFLKELDPKLETISKYVHERLRNRAITAQMKASFDGFLLVILAGGPSRAFTRQDSGILEEDFKALKELYLADGDGLPGELVEKASIQVKSVLPLFKADTHALIEQFKNAMLLAHGATAKSRYPLPPTTGNWSSTDANTILRVLCHRNDEAASKFLKKMYKLPKKI